MGRIPTYRAKELPRVAEPAPPTFSARAIAGIRSLATHLERRRMQDDLVRVLEAEATLMNWQDGYLENPQSGLLARRGAAAKGSSEHFREAAEARYLELDEALETDSQRDLFRHRSYQLLRPGVERIMAHEAVETDLHRRSTLATAALSETRRALDLAERGEAEAADDRLQTATGFLGQSLDGAAVADLAQAGAMLISGYHSTRFSRLLADDPSRAGSYLRDNRAAIDAAVYPQLEQQAREAIDGQRGQGLHPETYRTAVAQAKAPAD